MAPGILEVCDNVRDSRRPVQWTVEGPWKSKLVLTRLAEGILTHLSFKTRRSIGRTQCGISSSHPRVDLLVPFTWPAHPIQVPTSNYNTFKLSNLRLNIMWKYVILTLLNDVITILTSLKCNNNVTQVIYTVFFCATTSFSIEIPIIIHQPFVPPAPLGPGNNRAFNFSIFKALHCGAKFVATFLLNATTPGVDNNATVICIPHPLGGRGIARQWNLALGLE